MFILQGFSIIYNFISIYKNYTLFLILEIFLLAATDNMSTQKYNVKILIIQNNLHTWSATDSYSVQ